MGPTQCDSLGTANTDGGRVVSGKLVAQAAPLCPLFLFSQHKALIITDLPHRPFFHLYTLHQSPLVLPRSPPSLQPPCPIKFNEGASGPNEGRGRLLCAPAGSRIDALFFCQRKGVASFEWVARRASRLNYSLNPRTAIRQIVRWPAAAGPRVEAHGGCCCKP